MTACYTVQTGEASVSVEAYLRTGVDVEKFLGYCKACPNYSTRWACPPFAFDPMEIWRKYRTLRLYARVLVPEPGAETGAVLEGMKREKQVLLKELLTLEKTVPGSLVLSAGSCDICGTCVRQEGTPCRHPEKLRYSIEALGGDVAGTAERYLHRPLLWIRDGRLPAYLTLVGGLLTMEEPPGSGPTE